MSNAIGFIYLCFNRETKMYYLGSHKGSYDDGYIGSGKFFKSAYNKNPKAFKRRILEFVDSIENLIQRENYWLSKIKPQELGDKYYNLKNVASGGDIISNLSDERKKIHAEKSRIASKNFWSSLNKNEKDLLKEKMKINSRRFWETLSEDEKKSRAFKGNEFNRSYMSVRNKKYCSKSALIKTPQGIEIQVNNIAEFCEENNLNYGNMKTVLRGNGKQKSCKGYTGKYL